MVVKFDDHRATGKSREYLMYIPVGYYSETAKKWPVILFLHGGGERGNGLEDLEKVLVHGPLYEAWIQGRDLPFIILSPQLPTFGRPLRNPNIVPPKRPVSGPPPKRPYGRSPEQPMARETDNQKPRWDETGPPQGWWKLEQDLLDMVDRTLREYRADAARVYLTGLSYGGFGSWHMAMTHPSRWAAVAPLCGAGNPKTVQSLVDAKMPMWIFQGGRDEVVRTEWVLETVQALEAAGHRDVRFTVHEDLGHNVWSRVYEGWDLYQWFLSHRRD